MSLQFYMDGEKKVLNPDLLDEKAEQIAGSFFDNRNKVSSSQLRKFYNEFKSLEKKNDSAGWDVIYPLIKMVKSKVAYATSDNKIKFYEKKVYGSFKSFMNEGIDSIIDEKDFKAFCKHFEAVVGFYYGKGGR